MFPSLSRVWHHRLIGAASPLAMVIPVSLLNDFFFAVTRNEVGVTT